MSGHTDQSGGLRVDVDTSVVDEKTAHGCTVDRAGQDRTVATDTDRTAGG